MIANIDDCACLNHVETYTPQVSTPQEQVDAAYISMLECQVKAMRLLCLGAMVEAKAGNSRGAYAILSQALTS